MTAFSDIRFSEAGNRLTAPMITRLMASALESPNLLSLAAGFTDTTTLPGEQIGEIVGKLVESPTKEWLQYGANQGRPVLRELLARRLEKQDSQAESTYSSERLFLANGSQQALALATQVLCDPGDIVLVQKPTYFVYLDVLRGLGVQARNLPVDGDNRLDPAGLEELLDRLERAGELSRVKAVYIQAYYSNPSTRNLDREEKKGLAEVLQRRGLRIPIIEDGAYRELYYETPPEAAGVLSLEEFAEFPVLYLGTLTKSFATGLKVGFGYCRDTEWLNRILYLKGQQDFGTSNFCQAIMERVLAEDYFEPYLAGLRGYYQEKMQALHSVLEREKLQEAGWSWEVPQGGLYLWLKGPEGFQTRVDSRFYRKCLENGVLYVPGDLCFGDEEEDQYVRLSFGVLSLENLAEAGRRFVRSATAPLQM